MKFLQINGRSLLVLGLFLALVIYFRAFLITNIFEPIAVVFWAIWRIIGSVHQSSYWTLLILICSILMIRFLPLRRNGPTLSYQPEQNSLDRVNDWLRLMKSAPLGPEETKYLSDSLKRLLISIFQVERCDFMKVDEQVMREAESLPEAVEQFLFLAETRQDDRRRILLMPKWFRRWANKKFWMEDIPMEETLTWMESMMEINHDQ